MVERVGPVSREGEIAYRRFGVRRRRQQSVLRDHRAGPGDQRRGVARAGERSVVGRTSSVEIHNSGCYAVAASQQRPWIVGRKWSGELRRRVVDRHEGLGRGDAGERIIAVNGIRVVRAGKIVLAARGRRKLIDEIWRIQKGARVAGADCRDGGGRAGVAARRDERDTDPTVCRAVGIQIGIGGIVRRHVVAGLLVVGKLTVHPHASCCDDNAIERISGRIHFSPIFIAGDRDHGIEALRGPIDGLCRLGLAVIHGDGCAETQIN